MSKPLSKRQKVDLREHAILMGNDGVLLCDTDVIRLLDEIDALKAQRDRLVIVGKAAMDWMGSLPTEIHILMTPELSARLAEVYDDLRSVLRDIEGGA